LEFLLKQIKSAKVIILPSVLNFEANLALKAKLESLVAGDRPRVGVDASRLSYIGSLFVGLLAYANTLVQELNGEFFLLAPNKKVLKILKEAHILKCLVIYKSELDIPDNAACPKEECD
jgi:anti-anti-sigma factor